MTSTMNNTMNNTTSKPKSTAKKKRKVEFNPKYPYYHLTYRALIQGNTIFAVAAPDFKTMEKAGWREFYLENDDVDFEGNEDFYIIADLNDLSNNDCKENVGLSRHDGRSGRVYVAPGDDTEYIRLNKFFTPVQNLADIENQFIAGETGLLFFFEEYDPANKDGLWAEFIAWVKVVEAEMAADPDADENDVNSIQWLLPSVPTAVEIPDAAEPAVEVPAARISVAEVEVEEEIPFAYAVVDENGIFVGCGQTLDDVSECVRDFYREHGTDTLIHIRPQRAFSNTTLLPKPAQTHQAA